MSGRRAKDGRRWVVWFRREFWTVPFSRDVLTLARLDVSVSERWLRRALRGGAGGG